MGRRYPFGIEWLPSRGMLNILQCRLDLIRTIQGLSIEEKLYSESWKQTAKRGNVAEAAGVDWLKEKKKIHEQNEQIFNLWLVTFWAQNYVSWLICFPCSRTKFLKRPKLFFFWLGGSKDFLEHLATYSLRTYLSYFPRAHWRLLLQRKALWLSCSTALIETLRSSKWTFLILSQAQPQLVER